MDVPRSQALWERTGAHDLPPLTQGLICEAGRLLDRLDRLDELLTGGDQQWLKVAQFDGEPVLIIDKALAEARNLAMAYARLVAELRQLGVTGKASDSGKPEQGVDLVDELARRRAANQ